MGDLEEFEKSLMVSCQYNTLLNLIKCFHELKHFSLAKDCIKEA